MKEIRENPLRYCIYPVGNPHISLLIRASFLFIIFINKEVSILYLFIFIIITIPFLEFCIQNIIRTDIYF